MTTHLAQEGHHIGHITATPDMRRDQEECRGLNAQDAKRGVRIPHLANLDEEEIDGDVELDLDTRREDLIKLEARTAPTLDQNRLDATARRRTNQRISDARYRELVANLYAQAEAVAGAQSIDIDAVIDPALDDTLLDLRSCRQGQQALSAHLVVSGVFALLSAARLPARGPLQRRITHFILDGIIHAFELCDTRF